jgi:hypothetical protein
MLMKFNNLVIVGKVTLQLAISKLNEASHMMGLLSLQKMNYILTLIY